MKTTYNQISFSDSDVVNPDDFIPYGEYNPHNIHPFLIHDHGFCIGVVFASNLQDALDILVDNDKLDSFLIPESDYDDYGVNTDSPACTFLGNAGEPFNIDELDVVELLNPKWSFCALFNASFKAGEAP